MSFRKGRRGRYTDCVLLTRKLSIFRLNVSVTLFWSRIASF